MIYTEVRGRAGDLHRYFLCRGRQDKVCDLPHLPVALVEDSVVRYYPSIDLGADFTEAATAMIRSTLADEQGSVRELHENYRKQLRALEIKEERLLDLATDGELPRDKIKARLRRIQIDRERAEAGLNETGESLAVGAQTLETYIRLLNQPAQLYAASPEPIRRQLNDAFFERLFIEERGVEEAWLTEVADELHTARELRDEALGRVVDLEQARRARRAKNESGPSDVLTGPAFATSVDLLASHWVSGSSKATMVGLTVFWFRTSWTHVSRHRGLMSQEIPES